MTRVTLRRDLRRLLKLQQCLEAARGHLAKGEIEQADACLRSALDIGPPPDDRRSSTWTLERRLQHSQRMRESAETRRLTRAGSHE